MKKTLHNQYKQVCQWLQDGCLVRAKQYQLMPIEALHDVNCDPQAVNVYYQNESANDTNLNIDFDSIVCEASRLVNIKH